MWNLVRDDPMRLRVLDLDEAAIQGMMKILFAAEKVPDLDEMLVPLYCVKVPQRKEVLAKLPLFDEWGLRPRGIVGKRGNPLIPFSGAKATARAEDTESSSSGSEAEEREEGKQEQGELAESSSSGSEEEQEEEGEDEEQQQELFDSSSSGGSETVECSIPHLVGSRSL